MYIVFNWGRGIFYLFYRASQFNRQSEKITTLTVEEEEEEEMLTLYRNYAPLGGKL